MPPSELEPKIVSKLLSEGRRLCTPQSIGTSAAVSLISEDLFQHSWPLMTTLWPERFGKSHVRALQYDKLTQSRGASHGNSEQSCDTRPPQSGERTIVLHMHRCALPASDTHQLPPYL